MSKRFPLAAEARVALANPDRFLPQIARHLEGHGARTSWRDGAAVIDFDFSRGVMQPHVDGLAIRAEAMDRSLLQEIQMELAEHLGEFAGVRPGDVVWRGDACGSDTPPNFRLLRVVEARYVTPHMRRVRLAGENLLRFSGSGNLHYKLLIPPSGIAPEWPTLDAGGSFRWPSGPGKPAIRKYTIRGIDVENGTLEVDLVVHGDNGPGSAWAISASPGDDVGMGGPGGLSPSIAAFRATRQSNRRFTEGDRPASNRHRRTHGDPIPRQNPPSHSGDDSCRAAGGKTSMSRCWSPC